MSFIHFVTHIDYGCSYKMLFLQSCATNCVPFFNIFLPEKVAGDKIADLDLETLCSSKWPPL